MAAALTVKMSASAERGKVEEEEFAMWLFGYGSLIWNPDFPYLERRTCCLHGWSRRFWQGSTDHRGVPGRPGRVVTLIQDPAATCWGVAYRMCESEAEVILARLDHREKGGYERHTVELWLEGQHRQPALVYVAPEHNQDYLGPAPMPALALQIRSAVGPSGPNPEYVLRLAASLRELAVEDEHVFELERHLTE